MVQVQKWFRLEFGVNPPLMLNGPRLFGLENEAPDDLHVIVYTQGARDLYWQAYGSLLHW